MAPNHVTRKETIITGRDAQNKTCSNVNEINMRLHSGAGISICKLEQCCISRNSTADIALGHWGRHCPQRLLLLQVYLRRRRILASPMSSQTALCTTLTMIASAWIPPPHLGCQSFFLNWVQNTVEAVPYPSSSSFDLDSVSGLSNSHSSTTGHGEHVRRRV